jgi:hypothetical protein
VLTPPQRTHVVAHRQRPAPPAPRPAQRRAGGAARVPTASRTVAAHEIERFRAGLAVRVTRAALLLDAEPPPHSDAWLELAEELQRACRRLASASHCLYEWAEPDDARADIDRQLEPSDAQFEPGARAVRRARRAGRRNVRLWNDQAL